MGMQQGTLPSTLTRFKLWIWTDLVRLTLFWLLICSSLIPCPCQLLSATPSSELISDDSEISLTVSQSRSLSLSVPTSSIVETTHVLVQSAYEYEQ